MAAEKNTFPLTEFVLTLFHNIPRLLLTNLLLAVPFAVLFVLFYFINSITGLHSNFILFLTVIPLFPFFAGVTQVTAHMVMGEEKVDVFQNFISGVKENFLRFLVHGVVFYLALVFSWFSISLYINFAQKNNIFYVTLVISVIIAVLFLFAFFYIPPMTVTFDLSMKNIYKNSFLMTFGELKHNVFAVLGLMVLALICATALFCCSNGIALVVVTVCLAGILVPSVASFIINYAVYDGMYSIIVNNGKKIDEINRKLENRKKGQIFDAEPEKSIIPEDFNDIDIDASADGDEYIYYNGKMVKRSLLIKQKNSQSGKEE